MNKDTDQLQAMLRALIARMPTPYAWGVILTGELTEERSAVVAITPNERLQLTPALIAATRGRLVTLSGYANFHVSVPQQLVDWGEHEPVPSVAFRMIPPTCTPRFAAVEIRGQMSWIDLSKSPLPLLMADRLPGWPP